MFRSASLLDLCRLSDDAWRALLRGSAMRRAGLRRIRRTLAYAAQHLDAARQREALSALTAHDSSRYPEVAKAIQWAADKQDSRA
jgi:epoxyqueuosine reductase QueG